MKIYNKTNVALGATLQLLTNLEETGVWIAQKANYIFLANKNSYEVLCTEKQRFWMQTQIKNHKGEHPKSQALIRNQVL